MLKIRLISLVAIGGVAMALNPMSSAQATSLPEQYSHEHWEPLIRTEIASLAEQGLCESTFPPKENLIASPSLIDAATASSAEPDYTRFIQLLTKVSLETADKSRANLILVKAKVKELGLVTAMLDYAKYVLNSDLTPEEEAKIRVGLERFDKDEDAQANMCMLLNFIRRTWCYVQHFEVKTSLELSDIFVAIVNDNKVEQFEGAVGLEYVCEMRLMLQ